MISVNLSPGGGGDIACEDNFLCNQPLPTPNHAALLEENKLVYTVQNIIIIIIIIVCSIYY